MAPHLAGTTRRQDQPGSRALDQEIVHILLMTPSAEISVEQVVRELGDPRFAILIAFERLRHGGVIIRTGPGRSRVAGHTK